MIQYIGTFQSLDTTKFVTDYYSFVFIILNFYVNRVPKY